jgi:hypothetical protein
MIKRSERSSVERFFKASVEVFNTAERSFSEMILPAAYLVFAALSQLSAF